MRIPSAAADKVTEWLGSSYGIVTTLSCIAILLLWGAALGFNSTWNGILGAATGIISIIFLVFLQHSDNRGNAAIQLKLDVITRVVTELLERDTAAEEKVIGAERLTEAEIKRLKDAAVERVRDAVEGAARYNGEND